MGQEFIIKSQGLEDKINQLLPSQGGFQAGVDLSASTTVIPIVDLTETAEGSSLRQDLQTAFSHTSVTQTRVVNLVNTTLVNTTGYYRVFGKALISASGVAQNININDGSSTKVLIEFNVNNVSAPNVTSFDFIVFLEAGDTLRATSDSTSDSNFISVATRQVADINGNLVNP